MAKAYQAIQRILVTIIRAYRYFISPLLGNRCRFYPSCSEYAMEALKRYGVFKGCYLAIFRICRCNPWCEGGVDHVPDNERIKNDEY